MRYALIAAVAAGLLLAAVARTETAPKSSLVVKAEVMREVRAKGPDGKETVKYVPLVGTANQGDILLFNINYTNTSTAEEKNSDIIYVVPQGSVFVEAGGAGAAVFVSIDRGERWARHPATIRFKDSTGKIVEQPVAPETITHVRWVFDKPLAPGQTGTVTLKVRIK